ncbi:hypothetical protein HDU96_006397 [Phlyctochytrium bullatum]|nr:hypothetical protein HDU96_006397 [Phlyctochytrium bullatum]
MDTVLSAITVAITVFDNVKSAKKSVGDLQEKLVLIHTILQVPKHISSYDKHEAEFKKLIKLADDITRFIKPPELSLEGAQKVFGNLTGNTLEEAEELRSRLRDAVQTLGMWKTFEIYENTLLLLKAAEKPNAVVKSKSDEPLEIFWKAVKTGDVGTLRAILELKTFGVLGPRYSLSIVDKDNFTPLKVACKANDAEMVKVLFEFGAVADKEALKLSNSVEIWKMFLEKLVPAPTGSLWKAVVDNEEDQVKLYLARGDNPDVEGMEYLRNGFGSQKKEGGGARDKVKMQPLHYAAFFGRYEIARALLDGGANKNAKAVYDQRTPLHYAVYSDEVEVVRLLVKSGADTEAKDLSRKTPEKYAKSEEVKQLLKGQPTLLSPQTSHEARQSSLQEESATAAISISESLRSTDREPSNEDAVSQYKAIIEYLIYQLKAVLEEHQSKSIQVEASKRETAKQDALTAKQNESHPVMVEMYSASSRRTSANAARLDLLAFPAEILSLIWLRNHPKDLVAVAASCRSLRRNVKSNLDSMAFVKPHLELLVQKQRKRWFPLLVGFQGDEFAATETAIGSSLVKCLRRINLDHPLLRLYMLAAVAFVGITPSLMDAIRKKHLFGRSISNSLWPDLLAQAVEQSLCKFGPSDVDVGHPNHPVWDAFKLSGISRSRRLFDALRKEFLKNDADDFNLPGMQEFLFRSVMSRHLIPDHVELLQTLMWHNVHPLTLAPLSQYSFLEEAAREGHKRCVKAMATCPLVGRQDLVSPLRLALQAGHRGVARILVEAGADITHIDSRGETMLHAAVASERTKAVQFVVDSAPRHFVDLPDSNGKTPHSLALELGCRSIARLLSTASPAMSTASAASKTSGSQLLVKSLKIFSSRLMERQPNPQ